MIQSFRNTLLVLACSASVAAYAQNSNVKPFQIPAGDLVTALDSLARQSGAQFIYQAEQLKGLRTPGVSGTLSTDDALTRLLAGSGLTLHHDASGAVIIMKGSSQHTAPSSSRSTSGKVAPGTEADPEKIAKLDAVQVTGSRIPRAQIEGPAPIVTITSQDITNNGFATVAEVMTSLTQNLGSLDNNQHTNGFSPGAQAVDLRGLGPNHTLVLVNGRRIADYPQSYGGNSNFTDISNLPTSLIDRVEILSGSASAIYGSDAISGVINFILKKKTDGTTLDYRVGDTQHGGHGSQRLQITSGFSRGNFDSVFGLEYVNQKPLWAYQRSFTDSRLDSPAPRSKIVASQVFTRLDEDDNYIDPGKATCDALSSYDRGSIIYAYRRNYGYYCGSYQDVGYGTLQNGRKAVNFYGTASYRLSGHMEAFLDIQAATSHQDSYDTPLQWQNSYQLNGDSTPIPFYNQATGQVEQWQRRYFTIEENGGFRPGTIRNINNTLSLNTGIKGSIPDTAWTYEALFGHSQNSLQSKWPALVSARAQALYLGPSLGVDPDTGYDIYNAPISRLYTPLTVSEFRSITQDSIDHDKSRAENFSLTTTNTELFNLPGGAAGFAGVLEYGNQYYGLKPDPLSLDGTYYGLHNTGAVGSRDHAGAGVEFNAPILNSLTLTAAGRYDRYRYGTTAAGKFTYSLGLEYRPFDSLLLRGSAGTGFRAPDLSYLFAGLSGSSSGGTDYYLCRRDEPSSAPDFADDCDNGDVGFNGRSHGSTALKNETSKSYTFGFVFSPIRNLDISADYYRIKLTNEVQYQSSDMILREEADCRLGRTTAGAPVDSNSALCQQVVTQVVRNSPTAPSHPEGITSVLVLPINAAMDRTSGVDFAAHYMLDAHRAGKFDFNLGLTYVEMHKVQLFKEDQEVNELTDLYSYVIPRSKASYSVTWTKNKLSATVYGSRLGGLPNYDGDQRLAPTFVYNGSLAYRITPRASLTFVVDNLFDKKPAPDSTWTSYPFYSRSWFNPLGRAYYIQANYRFGGTEGG
jgi:outer membrane receptor protein involved in Fe transport